MPVQGKEVCSVCGRKKDGLVLPHKKKEELENTKGMDGSSGDGDGRTRSTFTVTSSVHSKRSLC